jgi:hypothetical protein
MCQPLGVSLVHDPQVAVFLMQLKEAIARRHYIVIQREKNNEFLARHGMSPKEREEVLLGLRADDYCCGPEMDPEYPGEAGVWEFKTKYLGIEICIKVKLLPFESGFAKDDVFAKDGYYAKCSSFHD